MAKTLTISMPEEMFKFLEENHLLSPSKIFQVKMNEIIETSREMPSELQKSMKLNNTLKERIQSCTEFITIKGLWEEYCEYDKKNSN